ncbi:hypothetical protein GCM10027290_55660 [Micromonospora sonneratiae]|uniref:Multiprotein-bridging factor 1 family protein n=1 Tax=Micromonospora sonneratiae TaxID=1184706 RepID=A0ABW3YJ27_9ACTN
MSERDWSALRDRRAAAPGAADAYEAARLAAELGRGVRELRESRGWSLAQLSQVAGMTPSAIARFETGGTMPTLLVLVRLARALDTSLAVQFQDGDAVL